jgi:hypothetical protein
MLHLTGRNNAQQHGEIFLLSEKNALKALYFSDLFVILHRENISFKINKY